MLKFVFLHKKHWAQGSTNAENSAKKAEAQNKGFCL
jgi:hypothetical protein